VVMNSRNDLRRQRKIAPAGWVIDAERSVIIGGTLTTPLAHRNCHELGHFIADSVPSWSCTGTRTADAALTLRR